MRIALVASLGAPDREPQPGNENGSFSGAHFPRRLDRLTTRNNTQRNLGTRCMVDAYERALNAVAATPVAMAS